MTQTLALNGARALQHDSELVALPPDTFVLSLGANLEDPEKGFHLTLEELRSVARDLRVAPLYRTAPLSPIPQTDFLNTVVSASSSLDATALLDLAQRLERKAGRRPGPRHGPRALDVDLLLHGEEVLSSSRLTLPHPRMRERLFVLQPLYDLFPELRLPPDGEAVRALWLAARRAGQRVHSIDWAEPPPELWTKPG